MSQRISFSSLRGDFSDRLRSGLVERPLAVTCWRCHRDTSSDMKWVCPHCDFDNHRTQIYSFLNKCQKCEHVPNGVVCPHCEAVISDDRGASFVAREYVPQKPPPPPPPPLLKEAPEVREQREHEVRKAKLRRDIEIARLEADLAKAKSEGKVTAEETEEQKKDKETAAYVNKIMGYHKSVQKAKLQAQRDYKDDPDGLQKIEMALEQFGIEKSQP